MSYPQVLFLIYLQYNYIVLIYRGSQRLHFRNLIKITMNKIYKLEIMMTLSDGVQTKIAEGMYRTLESANEVYADYVKRLVANLSSRITEFELDTIIEINNN
jgi:hypothetical protein